MIFVLAACGAAPSATKDSPTEAYTSVDGAGGDSGAYADVSLQEVGTLAQPVDAATRAGDPAIYFVSRLGTVHRFVDGSFESTAVLDIGDLTVGDGERGLLGLAFSPDGATAYVNYTDASDDTTIAVLTVDESGRFDRSTLRTLLVIEQPYRNHNAGDLVVEPSGNVLIPMGDGGSADDPERVALNDDSLLGKVVRLDPRTGTTSVLAKGLRNPWRVDLFDDRLWLADVGQNRWEEVSVLDDVAQRRGATFTGSSTRQSSNQNATKTEIIDFGWSAYEANERFNDDQSSPGHVPPVIAYEHGDDGCSVSGGAVAAAGALRGRYVFADYCSGRVWSIATNDDAPVMLLHFDDIDSPSAVVRANGELFVLSLSGTIWRIDG